MAFSKKGAPVNLLLAGAVADSPRYTDFLVNEILPSGQVVHLDSLKAPKQGAKAEQSTQTETPSSGSVGHFAAPAQAVSDSASKKENVKPDSAPEKSVAKTGAEAPEPEVKPTETAAKWQAYAATPSGTQVRCTCPRR